MTSLNGWIEEKIRDKDITYFEYSKFTNISEVGIGGYGVVNKADLPDSRIRVALKTLINSKNSKVEKNDIKELVKEVRIILY